MRVRLLFPDRDLDPQSKPADGATALARDLDLDAVLEAMAGGDAFLLETARTVLFSRAPAEGQTILYRQEIVKDCLRNPEVARTFYALALEAIEARKKAYFGGLGLHPGTLLYESLEVMGVLLGLLRRLRSMAEDLAERFASNGFTALFAMLREELDDRYLAEVKGHLDELRFRRGVLASARLGQYNQGADYVLRHPGERKRSWLDRLLRRGPPGHVVRIAERDEAGARALSELRERAINQVANALAQSADHVVSFFEALRLELAFYVGCLNLHDGLRAAGAQVAFPQPEATGTLRRRIRGLYDVGLALRTGKAPVPNDVAGDGKSLVVVTGANQGGKSTFLRGIGQAQLMMQAGMFVGAEAFAGEICQSLFTHFKREEDAAMKSGKFDEELGRMSAIAEALSPGSLVLFNESFAATNEREGSEIASQIVRALLEKRVRVFFVTHMYELAHGLAARRMPEALFLRAERRPDGTRTFKLLEGEPLATSFGEDVYREVFGDGPDEQSAA